MDRRGFLGAILAAAAAPAIVRAQSLMPIVAPKIITARFDPSDPLGQRFLIKGELGTIERFRFVTSPELPVSSGEVLTLEKLRRAVRTLKRNSAKPVDFVYITDDVLFQQLMRG